MDICTHAFTNGSFLLVQVRRQSVGALIDQTLLYNKQLITKVLATSWAYQYYPSQESRQKINSSLWGLYGLPTWRRDQKSKYLIAKKVGVELEIPVGFSTPKVKSFKITSNLFLSTPQIELG